MSKSGNVSQLPPSMVNQMVNENKERIAALVTEAMKHHSPTDVAVWVADVTNAPFWKFTAAERGEAWTTKAAAEILSEAIRDKRRPVWLYANSRKESQHMMKGAPEIAHVLSSPPPGASELWLIALLGDTIEAKPIVYQILPSDLERDATTGFLTFTCEFCNSPVISGLQLGSDNIRNAKLTIQAQCKTCGRMPAPRTDHFDVVHGALKRIGSANPTREEAQALSDILQSPDAQQGPHALSLRVAAALPRIAAEVNAALSMLSDDWPTRLPALSAAVAAIVTQLAPQHAAAASSASATFNLLVALLAPKRD